MRIYSHKKFFPGFQHLYYRSDDWGVIFYDDYDRLSYYTQQCVAKKKTGVVVLAASYMFTHIHNGVIAKTKKSVSEFAWKSTAPYAKVFNNSSGHKGAVFHREFGWASKRIDKQVRSTLCYIVNNHVEKGLCARASQSRWDFLAYATSSHPFSREITNPSPRLKYAMKVAYNHYSKNQPLTKKQLRKMFSDLDCVEREQLIDYIISTYRLVDFDKTVKYFRGYDEMLTAPDIVTGNEYDIAEGYTSAPDISYVEMISLLEKDKTVESVFRLNSDEQITLARDLSRMTNATADQIAKFLHLPSL